MKNILAGEKKYEKGYIKVSHEYLDKEAEKRRLEYISNKRRSVWMYVDSF